MTRWISPAALSSPVGTRPYHEEGRVIQSDGTRVLLTLCGCAIQWGDDSPVMAPVSLCVARLISRPCKDCARRRLRR